jgi:hypothetical protein
LEFTGNCQDPVVDTWHNLANASLYTSLVAQISNILACLADDHASLFGRNNGTERQLGLRVFSFSLGWSVITVAEIDLVHRFRKAGIVMVVERNLSVGGSHFVGRCEALVCGGG